MIYRHAGPIFKGGKKISYIFDPFTLELSIVTAQTLGTGHG